MHNEQRATREKNEPVIFSHARIHPKKAHETHHEIRSQTSSVERFAHLNIRLGIMIGTRGAKNIPKISPFLFCQFHSPHNQIISFVGKFINQIFMIDGNSSFVPRKVRDQ